MSPLEGLEGRASGLEPLAPPTALFRRAELPNPSRTENSTEETTLSLEKPRGEVEDREEVPPTRNEVLDPSYSIQHCKRTSGAVLRFQAQETRREMSHTANGNLRALRCAGGTQGVD